MEIKENKGMRMERSMFAIGGKGKKNQQIGYLCFFSDNNL